MVSVLPVLSVQSQGCISYGKSIKRATIEGEFEALLHSLQPTENLFLSPAKMFEDLWSHRFASHETRVHALQGELKKVDRQIEQFLDRSADTEIASVIASYEKRIQQLEQQKIVWSENIEKCGRPIRSFDEHLEPLVISSKTLGNSRFGTIGR